MYAPVYIQAPFLRPTFAFVNGVLDSSTDTIFREWIGTADYVDRYGEADPPTSYGRVLAGYTQVGGVFGAVSTPAGLTPVGLEISMTNRTGSLLSGNTRGAVFLVDPATGQPVRNEYGDPVQLAYSQNDWYDEPWVTWTWCWVLPDVAVQADSYESPIFRRNNIPEWIGTLLFQALLNGNQFGVFLVNDSAWSENAAGNAFLNAYLDVAKVSFRVIFADTSPVDPGTTAIGLTIADGVGWALVDNNASGVNNPHRLKVQLPDGTWAREWKKGMDPALGSYAANHPLKIRLFNGLWVEACRMIED